MSELRGSRRDLRQTASPGGYLFVSLYVLGKQRVAPVHRLVCETFHGPPAPGQEVRHLDGARGNNAASNLAWGTRRENMADKRRHGTAQVGALNGMATLSEADVVKIRALAASGERQTGIAAKYGVTTANVSSIVRGETWAHVPMPDMSARVTREGERHAHAKLTAADVRDIRARVRGGESQRAVAAAHNVTPANVCAIVSGRAWAQTMEAL